MKNLLLIFSFLPLFSLAQLTCSLNGVNILCNGDSTGSIGANILGGTIPYTYLWTGPGGPYTTQGLTGLTAGTYSLTVTDSNGDTTTCSITLTESAELLCTVTGTDLLCYQDNSGTIDLSVYGGNPPYTYLWNGPGGPYTTQDLTGLAAGTYNVMVTDAYGCITTCSITLTEPPLFTSSISGTDLLCYQDNSGTATVNATGGTMPYTYSWNGPGGPYNTTATITGLAAGTYFCMVTDANGSCTGGSSITLTEPPPFTIVSSQTNVSCNGGSDGALTVNVSGATPPYTYLWIPNAQTTATATGLTVGTYQCTITDANGCDTTVTFNITQPSFSCDSIEMLVNPLSNQDTIKLNGLANNITPATVSSWQWNISNMAGTVSSNSTLQDPMFAVNSADTFIVCLTSDIFCGGIFNTTCTVCDTLIWNSGWISYSILNSPPLSCSVTGTDLLCYQDNSGTATVNATGGTMPYTYSWTGPGGPYTTPTITGLAAGTYSVVVTDDNGSTTTCSITLTEPPSFTIVQSQVNVSCFGWSDGIATVNVSGATPPYTYFWSTPNAQTTPTATSLTAGTFTCTITDANGCDTTITCVITEPTQLICSVVAVNPTGSLSNGSIDLTLTGATMPYIYSWTGPGGMTYNTEDISGLAAGTYFVVVTDANGCTTTCSISLVGTSTGLNNYTTSKKLLKVTDILGRDTKGRKNKILLYIYNDGIVEKRIIIE